MLHVPNHKSHSTPKVIDAVGSLSHCQAPERCQDPALHTRVKRESLVDGLRRIFVACCTWVSYCRMQRDRVKEKDYEYCICDTVRLIQGLGDEFD